MWISGLVFAGLSTVMAVPVTIESRQIARVYNELKIGPCKPVTFIMARGSTEASNMGGVGSSVCTGLKGKLGADKVCCQGIGTDDGYAAALPPNAQPRNTDAQSIQAAVKIITMASTKCPDTSIVLGGYSQGSAVIDNGVQAVPANVRSKIAGVVMFGFTRNLQDRGQIPGYPKAQTKIFCNPGDMVCSGTLMIMPAHLAYGPVAGEAATFLASMVQAHGGATGGTSAAGGGGASKQSKSSKGGGARLGVATGSDVESAALDAGAGGGGAGTVDAAAVDAGAGGAGGGGAGILPGLGGGAGGGLLPGLPALPGLGGGGGGLGAGLPGMGSGGIPGMGSGGLPGMGDGGGMMESLGKVFGSPLTALGIGK